MDMLPTLAFDGDKMTAVWAKSEGNVLDGSECKIMAADYEDGKWETPYSVVDSCGYVSELTVHLTLHIQH